MNRDCIDAEGYVIHDKLRPAHYCGHAYLRDSKMRFVASYEVMEVGMVYDGPEARKMQLVGAPPAKRG
ncbi:MAG: hypothetical protein A3G27_01245 [Betaproteobacteria bacterium RIFCSPLOWO2_12_FULL_66_14]|nr:MAG: hypothetical protein A3G27_01245 [Betaproteobacteria bacterium RIFCSPLOWO2_12_FULL_66_14]